MEEKLTQKTELLAASSQTKQLSNPALLHSAVSFENSGIIDTYREERNTVHLTFQKPLYPWWP